MKAVLSKTRCDADISTLQYPFFEEHCITVLPYQDRARLLRKMLAERKASALSVFDFCGALDEKSMPDPAEMPAVRLRGDGCPVGCTGSLQAVALSNAELSPVFLNGRPAGHIYEDSCARYCRLSGILPADPDAPRTEQVRSVFELLNEALVSGGFQFTDTVRTWIYLDRLLDWYDDFNAVRTQFFNEQKLFENRVPASTGIGAANRAGAAVTMDLLAVKPKDSRLVIQEVVSPLQNPALNYKSSFSRAMEMAFPTHRNLMISGTASIAPDGKSAHQDDPEKQIYLTLDVVHAILRSRDMDWKDLYRGIAYFKDMKDLPLYRRIAAERGIPDFSLAFAQADVCRHDLLFELEADAFSATDA